MHLSNSHFAQENALVSFDLHFLKESGYALGILKGFRNFFKFFDCNPC